MKQLFALPEEIVVGGVRYERLITDIGGGGTTVGGGRSPFGVQALDEGGFSHDSAARWPLLRTNRLK